MIRQPFAEEPTPVADDIPNIAGDPGGQELSPKPAPRIAKPSFIADAGLPDPTPLAPPPPSIDAMGVGDTQMMPLEASPADTSSPAPGAAAPPIVPEGPIAPPPADPTLAPSVPDPQFDMAELQALLGQFGSTGPSMDVINPVADLRSTIISGEPSDRTTAARTATDAAANAMTKDATQLAGTETQAAEKALGVDPAKVTGANTAVEAALKNLSETDRQSLVDKLVGQYMEKTGPSDRLSKLQGQVDSAADSLAGVDRYKLAKEQFDTFATDTDPAFQKTLRDIKERESGAGGFTGRLNTSFGDAGLTRERDLRSERSRLLQKALDDSVQDALSKTGMLSGLEGQLSAEDLKRFSTAAGFGMSDANADIGQLESVLAGARGHASDLTAAEQAAINTGTSRAGQQLDNERSNVSVRSGLESQSFGEDQSEANALRGERDYEVGQESQAYGRALTRHQQEQADMAAAFDRELSLLGAGETGNPSGQIGALATQINPALDLATIAQLAQSAGYANGNKQTGPAGPAGTDWASIISSLLSGKTAIPTPTVKDQPTMTPG